MSTHPQTEHDEHAIYHEHVTPVGIYLLTYVALIVLLAATVGIYYVPLGPLNNLAALTIAVIKALLVILFFMGVRWGTRLTWLWVGAGFTWLLLMFGTLGDYLTRGWIKIPGW